MVKVTFKDYLLVTFFYIISISSLLITPTQKAAAQTNVDSQGLFASVVYIVADAQVIGSAQRRQFFGSGVIITPEGHVLTSAHVLPDILDPNTYTDVHLSGVIGNKYGYPIELQRTGFQNVDADLIILKFPSELSSNLKPAQVPAKLDVVVDSSVTIVGFPLSLDASILHGNIVTLNGPNETWITDAKIQKGSSGSPVFNLFGQLIGIASGGFDLPGMQPIQSPLGLNLIIPITKARNLAGALSWQVSEAERKVECKNTPITISGKDASFPESASIPLNRLNIETELPGVLATSYPWVILDNATTRLSAAQAGLYRFCRLDLKNNSKLVVGEKPAFILSNYFTVSSDSGVIGIPQDSRTERVPDAVTAAGQSGLAGTPGRSSGSLLLAAFLRFNGTLHVDLEGEHGGPGGQGGPGSPGAQGSPGVGGSDGIGSGGIGESLFECKRVPGDGERGFPGGQGGAGGPGGSGGNGGNLQVYRLRSTVFPFGSVSFSGRGGSGGAGGLGGPGGPGGNGGPGGAQTTYCHGGSDGPKGPTGAYGPSGTPGVRGLDGSMQNSVVSERDLINLF